MATTTAASLVVELVLFVVSRVGAVLVVWIELVAIVVAKVSWLVTVLVVGTVIILERDTQTSALFLI